MRVAGIDPGTLSLDLCGLDHGRLILDRSIPTREALADPSLVLGVLDSLGPLDLVVGPSGYGLPVTRARDLTEAEIRLACLAPRGESGGIGGLSSLMRALGASTAPVVVTPGVVHLPSVPSFRKINRIDMGTADKVCVSVLAVHEHMRRHQCLPHEVSLIVLELGGAFTCAMAIEAGRIVDGLGGSSGPIGVRAPGALDAEVAFLAGRVTKEMVFSGGALDVSGDPDARVEVLANPVTPAAETAWEAFLEGAVKAVAAVGVSVPEAQHIALSGRVAGVPGVREELARRLSPVIRGASVEVLTGFASVTKHAAQGAALLADGLAGGSAKAIVDRLGIRDARGTVLDHLHVIAPADARKRLGIG